jgi:hypothetical protein
LAVLKVFAIPKKYSSVLLIAFGAMAMLALPARANILTGASANATCAGFSNLVVSATDLTQGTPYTIDYSFTVTCNGGTPVTTSGSYNFTASGTTETVTVGSGTFSTTAVGSCEVTGSATLTSSGSQVPITINGITGTAPVTCPSTLTLACPANTGQVGVPYDSCLVATGGVPPYTFTGISGGVPGIGTLNQNTGCITGTPTEAGTFQWEFEVTDSNGNTANTDGQCSVTVTSALPTACVIPPSGTAIPGAPVSWNGFTAPAGSVVWINAHISGPSNVPTNTITTVVFTGVNLVVNTTSYALPNGTIVFNPATSTPNTVVNADGSWTTTVNPSQSGDIFFVGQAIPVDSNLENGGHGNTGSTLSFTTNSSDSDLDFQWQWGAAVYTSWPGNAAANIAPVPTNGLQSGAPQNQAVQKDLIQGPRGGGGSNFTGSWSGTGQGKCPQ